MIDKLQRIAQAIQMLRLPSMAAGIISLASLAAIIFIFEPREGDRFIIPSLVCLLWALSTFAFIITFRSVPEKVSNPSGFFNKFKHNMTRGWYWMMGVVFLAASLTVVVLTIRMVSIWSRDHG